jgi:hypothetical protein
MTMEEIYTAGLAALKRELGVLGMVRFLQFIDSGRGDYTKDRRQWLKDLTVDDIVAEIERTRDVKTDKPPR